MKYIYIKVLLSLFCYCFCTHTVYSKNYPEISISIDKTEILKDGGEATVTISLSKKSNGNKNAVQFNLSYETNGSGSINYDFQVTPSLYYHEFAKNETSVSFKIKGIYQEWGSDNVNLDVSIYNIQNATISGPQKISLDIKEVLSGSAVDDTEDPVFQNPQSNISVSTDAGLCGAIVTYTTPTATDNSSVPTESISGYSYLGQFDGHSYYYSNSSVNAASAIQNSIDLGGHLVTLGSQSENDFIINNISSSIWIGFTDVSTEGNFQWVTSEFVAYANWNGAEPNDSGGEDYTEMYTNGKWNDVSGSGNRRYVLEFQPVLITQTTGLSSGSNFPVGTTTNTFVATDMAGNTSIHSFDVIVTDNSPPEIAGLRAEYYDGIDFNEYKETLNVSELNYYWGSGAPESNMVGKDVFSVRFRGFLKSPQTGVYTFYTSSDDGVRLWVDNILVIDNWTYHGTTVNTGTVSLTANRMTSIKLEYFENYGGAVIKLEWEGPGLAREYVKDMGGGTCEDLVLDLSASGSVTIDVDDIDPGYVDACGIATRVVSKTYFDCSDSGANAVSFIVTDVNGNSSSCNINVQVIGAPDISLLVTGDTKCQGEDATILIENSEIGVIYSCYIGASQVGSSVNGTGSNLNIIIPSSDMSLGNNSIVVKASKGVCDVELLNKANVLINLITKPIGIYFDN